MVRFHFCDLPPYGHATASQVGRDSAHLQACPSATLRSHNTNHEMKALPPQRPFSADFFSQSFCKRLLLFHCCNGRKFARADISWRIQESCHDAFSINNSSPRKHARYFSALASSRCAAHHSPSTELANSSGIEPFTPPALPMFQQKKLRQPAHLLVVVFRPCAPFGDRARWSRRFVTTPLPRFSFSPDS